MVARTRAYRSRRIWVPALAASLIVQGSAVGIYYGTRPTPQPELTIRLGDAAASWSVAVEQRPDKESGLIVRATKAKQGRQAHTFDIKVRTDAGVITARSGERVPLPNKDQAVQVTVAEQGGQTITKTVRVKQGEVSDADIEFTPSRGQVLVTKVGDVAPLLRCSSPRCSVDVAPGTEVKLTAVLGEEATFGGFHQFPMRTPSALVPWLGDPVAQCNAGSALDAAARGDIMDCTIKVKADTDVAVDFGEVPERIDVAFTDETKLDQLIQPLDKKITPPPAPIDAEKLEEDKPLEVAMIKPPPQIKPPEIKPPPPPPPEAPKPPPPKDMPNMVMVEVKDDKNVKDKAPDDAKQLSDKNRDVAEESRATKTNLEKESEGKSEASAQSDDTKSVEVGGPDDKIRQLEETKSTNDNRVEETDHSGDKAIAQGEIKGEAGDDGEEGTGEQEPGILSMRGIGGRGNVVDQKKDGKRIGKKGLPGLNTNLAFQDYERIMGKDKVDDERQVAARKMSAKKGRWERKLAAIKSSLENFVPDVRPGNQTALKTRAHPFAVFVARMHRRIHELWGFGFLEDLDEKGASHPLNDPNLWVNLEVAVNTDGSVHKVTIAKTSGKTEFDVAAVDTVISAAPYEATPEAIRSSNGRVYLRWGFYRNWRQCGTFNVEPYILTDVPDDNGAGTLDDGAMVANTAKLPGKKRQLPAGATDKPVTPDDGRAKQKVNPDSNVTDKQALFAANLWVSAFATASVDKLVKYSAVPFYAAGKVAATTQADLKDMYSGLLVESGPMKDWRLLSAREYTSGSTSLPDGNVVLQVRTAKESFAVVLTRTPSGDYRATQLAR